MKPVLYTSANISFVRNRILYARAAFNAEGGIRFGLRHIRKSNLIPFRHTSYVSDVLNRFPHHAQQNDGEVDETSSKPHANTLRIMMYIFPRQFRLHNVFTCKVNPQETVQPFQDYTLREDEIKIKYPSPTDVKVPRRMRGNIAKLVYRFQVQHSRCAYKKLLYYYCPVSSPFRCVERC